MAISSTAPRYHPASVPTDHERLARTPQELREHVDTVRIGAEPVRGGRAGKAMHEVDLIRIVRRDPRPDHAEHEEHQDHRGADPHATRILGSTSPYSTSTAMLTST
jgi:hypothetical protein